MFEVNLNEGAREPLSLNTVGNMLGTEILNHTIQHVTSMVNRTEEIENELFSFPLRVQNLNWKQFCDVDPSLKLAGSRFVHELCDDQVLLFETNTYGDKTRLILSNPDHLIPNIENFDNSTIYTKNDKQINNKGLIVEQYRRNMGIVSYIPFLPGKKIIGLLIRTTGVNQFYYAGSFKTSTSVPNISIDGTITPRSLRGILTETDKIIISNASSRFRNQVSSWHYLKDALIYFNKLLLQTVDPSYICKLITLNKVLSFPART